MRKGFTLNELLLVILLIAGTIFVGWATLKGSPDVRLMTGIALTALYLPAMLTGIIHYRVNAWQVVPFAIGILLIASKFIFPA